MNDLIIRLTQVFVGLGLLFLVCTSALAQNDHMFRASGGSANVYFCNDLGCGSVNVSLGGTPADRQAFLWYSLYRPLPNGFVEYWGYADLPGEAVKIAGATVQHVRLDTSVAGSACTFTWDPYSYECVPSSGAIALEWRQDGAFDRDMVINERQNNGSMRVHRVGHESSSSANVTGTFFGLPVATAGWVGMTRDMTITVSQTKPAGAAAPGELQMNLVDPATVSRHRNGPALNKADYTFSYFDYPGAVRTRLSGISDNGVIVGSYAIPGRGQHGFVSSGGTFTTIEPQGAITSQARGINNAGQIVGLFYDENGATHGFLFSNGAYKVLDFPGYEGMTQATGIAPDGTIVGQVLADEGAFGFVLKDGAYSELRCERAGNTQPMGTAPNGTVVGACDTDVPLSYRGFWMKNGTPQLYDVPGADATALRGVAANGLMVGAYTVDGPYAGYHGFVYDGQVWSTLDVPDAGTVLTGINAAGQIVGYINNGVHGVLFVRGNSQKPPAP